MIDCARTHCGRQPGGRRPIHAHCWPGQIEPTRICSTLADINPLSFSLREPISLQSAKAAYMKRDALRRWCRSYERCGTDGKDACNEPYEISDVDRSRPAMHDSGHRNHNYIDCRQEDNANEPNGCGDSQPEGLSNRCNEAGLTSARKRRSP